ncbi:hypothetical protein V2A60_000082 [Cordyceps javanica]|uniref:Zn(II)2Cys6 transcription factor n=1 Tax=Cordyceps javanica TaxID=43265 RepID=A0A545V6F0_9HYPO|nr:Zn(II)2Cys6 transcription factor [Cordyceps javanica]TQW08539.1 Zn(II)2Cys6 transcription factor [Cordyceps javanica]
MTKVSVVCVSEASPASAVVKDTAATDGQQKPRRKRFAPRTRTGCLTCRERRIKCDEARPACQRCIRAWRPCGGYHLPPPALPAADSRLLQPTPVVPTAAELALGRYFVAEIGAVAADEFNATFWCRDVPQVARAVPAVWHASNALAGAAWARSPAAGLSPRTAALVEHEGARQYSASVRHILQVTTTTQQQQQQQQQQPSQRHPQRPSPRDQTTVLLASILLSSYAMSIGERAVFASIVATSRRLVRQWAFWECLDVTSVAALAAQILYVYVKTERVAQEFHLETVVADEEGKEEEEEVEEEKGGDKDARRPPLRWHRALAALQRRPLTSALRACVELDMVWNSVHDILDALPLAAPTTTTTTEVAAARARRCAFAPLFQSWQARYAAYTAGLRSRRAPLDVDIAALDLRRMLVDVLLRVPLDNGGGGGDGDRSGDRGRPPVWDETCWDPFTRDFAAAVACLEAVLPLATAAAAATGAVMSTPSIYASCNFIVQKCRAPGLRRRAAAVLRNSLVAALGRRMTNDDDGGGGGGVGGGGREHTPLIVDRLILVEESAWELGGSGCGQDDACVPGRYICNMHRVVRVHIDRTVDGLPEVTFRTVGDILNGRPGHHEAMDISLSSCAMGG